MAKYPRMSTVLNKDEYRTYSGQKVMLNRRVVTVSTSYRSNRYGSWERGFKFSDTTIGVLTRRAFKKYPYNNRRTKWWQSMMRRSRGHVPVGYYVKEYSTDHGKTWHSDKHTAMKCRSKVVLTRDSRTELAFDAIQRINRSYDPSYRWQP